VVVVEGGLGRGRICGEEGLHKQPWVDALPPGGFDQAGKDAVGNQPAFRPGSEPDLAEDDQESQVTV
jgi:hypothetical protein